jgi:FlaA1/EpsC-like NDP-sugar epimerase
VTGRILIVGRGTAGKTLAADVRRRGGEVVGFLDDRVEGDDVLGTLRDVDAVVAAQSIDLVYFAIPTADSAKSSRVHQLDHF